MEKFKRTPKPEGTIIQIRGDNSQATYTCECGKDADWYLSATDGGTRSFACCDKHTLLALNWMAGRRVRIVHILYVDANG